MNKQKNTVSGGDTGKDSKGDRMTVKEFLQLLENDDGTAQVKFNDENGYEDVCDVISNDNQLLQKKIGSWSAGDSIFHTLMVDINTV